MVFKVIKAGQATAAAPLTRAQKAARINDVIIFVRNNPRIGKWAIDVRARGKGACEECGATHGITAHHIHELKEMIVEKEILTPEQALACAELWDIDNGIALCPACHAAKHGGKVPSTLT